MGKEMFIPLSVPNIKGNELKYVTEAIESEWVSTAGSYITTFEEKFSKYLNVKSACACQSGTAGLHLCLRVLDISEGDIVLVPTLTFIATINSLMYEKATPIFIDCDDNMCINIDQIRDYIENQCDFNENSLIDKATGARVKAVMPVHVFGDIANMEALVDICEKYKLYIIEDATEALGTKYANGKYEGRYAGTIGHLGVFSFNGNKIITTGGGGMVVSQDSKLIEKIKYLSTQAKDDQVYFVHNEVGYNYRMTNIQAAIGIGQLEKLNDFIRNKEENYRYYKERLVDSSLGKMVNFNENIHPNYWFYSFKLNKPDYKLRDELINYLQSKNIQTRPIWKLNHTQKPFEKYNCIGYETASEFYDSIINLPCSSNLTKEEVDRVCNEILKFELEKIGDSYGY
ncbi:LegC family aminotransferase [Clostridium sp. CTA-7]